MNLDSVEARLVAEISRLLRRKAIVRGGPLTPLPLGGMRETVFVHAARFVDRGDAIDDGAAITRHELRRGRMSGVVESRPARIVVDICCIATDHARVKAMSEIIAPAVLLVLAGEQAFELGKAPTNLAELMFADFSTHLRRAETEHHQDEALAYHRAWLEFYLDGTLHVSLATRGGLRKSSPGQRPRKKPSLARGKRRARRTS